MIRISTLKEYLGSEEYSGEKGGEGIVVYFENVHISSEVQEQKSGIGYVVKIKINK